MCRLLPDDEDLIAHVKHGTSKFKTSYFHPIKFRYVLHTFVTRLQHLKLGQYKNVRNIINLLFIFTINLVINTCRSMLAPHSWRHDRTVGRACPSPLTVEKRPRDLHYTRKIQVAWTNISLQSVLLFLDPPIVETPPAQTHANVASIVVENHHFGNSLTISETQFVHTLCVA